MALENLSPIVREERLLAGEDLEPANRLEYFLKQAGSGGSGSVEYEPVLAETTKSVNDHGWTTQAFSGGPIFEGTSYRVTVNGVTYEPLIGTAGDLGYICLGNTYVDDADPSGDYGFGIFYKDGNLTAWLETGESITMQIDQIIQLVPVPTPAAADTGKVLKANNGAVEWAALNRYDAIIKISYDNDDIVGEYVYGNYNAILNIAENRNIPDLKVYIDDGECITQYTAIFDAEYTVENNTVSITSMRALAFYSSAPESIYVVECIFNSDNTLTITLVS